MGSTFTTNLNLRKPNHRDPDTLDSWDYVLNSDFDILDAAVGSRVYTGQNYIVNSEPIGSSLNKLDMSVYDISLLAPTADQKAALIGPVGYLPNSGNPYATVNWVVFGAPVARKAILTPEYLGGVLWDGGVTPTGGTLISDFEFYSNPVTGPWGYNHYKWLSTAVGLETYYVVTRWKVPESFAGFNTTANKALTIDIATEDTGTDSQVIATIFKDGVAGTLSNIGPIFSTVATTWYSEREGTELAAYDATDAVLSSIAAGDVLVVMVGMLSANNKYAKVGDITIQYNG